MPFLSVIVELGQPAQGPHMQIDDAALKAAEDDVAAVLGDRGSHPGLDELADLADQSVVPGSGAPASSATRASASTTGSPDR